LPIIDTHSVGGKLPLNVLMSVAQWEREAIGERTQEALSERKRHGVQLGGAPYGWRYSNLGIRTALRWLLEIQPSGRSAPHWEGSMAAPRRLVRIALEIGESDVQELQRVIEDNNQVFAPMKLMRTAVIRSAVREKVARMVTQLAQMKKT
jgi:hypothetical protein